MLRFNPNTPLKFYYKGTTYTPGQGNVTSWVKIASGDIDTFYCQWKGAYGDAVITADNMGVKDWGTVKTFYNPDIYEKLKTVSVVVIKNADASAFVDGEINKNNMNVYELWGGVDNVLEQNQYMEFKVRRYEGL
jgi:hypothetical protein